MQLSEAKQTLFLKHELTDLCCMCDNIICEAAKLLTSAQNTERSIHKEISSAVFRIEELANNSREMCRERLVSNSTRQTRFYSAFIKITSEIVRISVLAETLFDIASKTDASSLDELTEIFSKNADICCCLIDHVIDAFVSCDVIKADSSEEIAYGIFKNSSDASASTAEKLKTGSINESDAVNLITAFSLLGVIAEKAINISRHALASFEL